VSRTDGKGLIPPRPTAGQNKNYLFQMSQDTPSPSKKSKHQVRFSDKWPQLLDEHDMLTNESESACRWLVISTVFLKMRDF